MNCLNATLAAKNQTPHKRQNLDVWEDSEGKVLCNTSTGDSPNAHKVERENKPENNNVAIWIGAFKNRQPRATGELVRRAAQWVDLWQSADRFGVVGGTHSLLNV